MIFLGADCTQLIFRNFGLSMQHPILRGVLERQSGQYNTNIQRSKSNLHDPIFCSHILCITSLHTGEIYSIPKLIFPLKSFFPAFSKEILKLLKLLKLHFTHTHTQKIFSWNHQSSIFKRTSPYSIPRHGESKYVFGPPTLSKDFYEKAPRWRKIFVVHFFKNFLGFWENFRKIKGLLF